MSDLTCTHPEEARHLSPVDDVVACLLCGAWRPLYDVINEPGGPWRRPNGHRTDVIFEKKSDQLNVEN